MSSDSEAMGHHQASQHPAPPIAVVREAVIREVEEFLEREGFHVRQLGGSPQEPAPAILVVSLQPDPFFERIDPGQPSHQLPGLVDLGLEGGLDVRVLVEI